MSETATARNGAIVFTWLKKQKVAMTVHEIVAGTGLSYPQVYNGLGHIRAVLGPHMTEPLINIPWTVNGKRATYELSNSAKRVKEYGAYRMRVHTKQLRNLGNTLKSAGIKFSDGELDLLAHQVNQMADTTEYVQKRLLGIAP